MKFGLLLKLIHSYIEDNNIEHDIHQTIENDMFNLKSNETLKITEKISLYPNNSGKKDVFIEMFENHSFKMYSEEFGEFYYKHQTNINSNKLSRLKKEFNILKKSISVNTEASLFFGLKKIN